MIDAMVIEINSSELESLEYDLSKGDTSSFSLVNSINSLTLAWVKTEYIQKLDKPS